MTTFYKEEKWCGREDSNFHPIARTATSTLRVYQFRHDRTLICRFDKDLPLDCGEIPNPHRLIKLNRAIKLR